MTEESKIIQRWEDDKEHYLAWGKFVVQAISKMILEEGKDPSLFLRIPVAPRLKGNSSLIQKALYRNKKYESPYDDIEDKVGIRLVVLTSVDISILESIVSKRGNQFWFVKKARDFVKERAQKPWEFGYQSVHYVVCSKVGLDMGGESIRPEIPCEIQIRTLLQHAYSELTHDTLYKPSVKSTPEMMRAAAKAMALIEATDDYFCKVDNLINDSVIRIKNTIKTLEEYYEEQVGSAPNITQLDGEVVEAYQIILKGNNENDIISWIERKKFIKERIKERKDHFFIYSIPTIFLIYFIVGHFPNSATSPGLLTAAELEPIYSDLGKTIPI